MHYFIKKQRLDERLLATPQFYPGADPQIGNHCSERIHLLDFGCIWDTLQVSLEHQDFGVFLFQDGDQVVQESDVPANTQMNSTLSRTNFQRSQCVKTCNILLL